MHKRPEKLETFKQNNTTIALKTLTAPNNTKQIRPAYISKDNLILTLLILTHLTYLILTSF